jgi:nucleotide-binding universal stress UspA family protein
MNVRGAVAPRPIRLTDWGLTDTAPDGDGDGSNFKRILLAVSDSAPSERAVAMVASLARSGGSEVCVVHLVERLFLGRAGYMSMETEDEAKGLVGRARDTLAKRGVPASAKIGRGRTDQIARRIIWAAMEFGADLIVIGTQGRSSLHAILVGSVAHGMIHRSKIPVLVVP